MKFDHFAQNHVSSITRFPRCYILYILLCLIEPVAQKSENKSANSQNKLFTYLRYRDIVHILIFWPLLVSTEMNRDDQRWPRYDVINDGCMAYGISSTYRVYIGYIGHISPVLTQLTQFSLSFSHNILFVNFLKQELLTLINLLSDPDLIIGLPWQHSTTGLFPFKSSFRRI